jgi:hypothetical protein
VGDSAAGGEVRLPDVPVRVFLESQDHQHELIRELQLIGIGGSLDEGAVHVSRRLAHLISGVLSDYEAVRSATRDQALAALDRGEHVVTLRVPVHPGIADALRSWLRLLEEADDLCRQGELLLLAPSPEVRRLRRWYVEQVTARLEADA